MLCELKNISSFPLTLTIHMIARHVLLQEVSGQDLAKFCQEFKNLVIVATSAINSLLATFLSLKVGCKTTLLMITDTYISFLFY